MLADEVTLRLAILNACEGGRSSLQDPFSGVATSLIEREIPAVIGMQFEITDRAAIVFASEFYSALADGLPVDSSVAEARKAIYADRNDIEWGTPVLFMRVADGRLFDVAAHNLVRSDVGATAIPAVEIAAETVAIPPEDLEPTPASTSSLQSPTSPRNQSLNPSLSRNLNPSLSRNLNPSLSRNLSPSLSRNLCNSALTKPRGRTRPTRRRRSRLPRPHQRHGPRRRLPRRERRPEPSPAPAWSPPPSRRACRGPQHARQWEASLALSSAACRVAFEKTEEFESRLAFVVGSSPA